MEGQAEIAPLSSQGPPLSPASTNPNKKRRESSPELKDNLRSSFRTSPVELLGLVSNVVVVNRCDAEYPCLFCRENYFECLYKGIPPLKQNRSTMQVQESATNIEQSLDTEQQNVKSDETKASSPYNASVGREKLARSLSELPMDSLAHRRPHSSFDDPSMLAAANDARGADNSIPSPGLLRFGENRASVSTSAPVSPKSIGSRWSSPPRSGSAGFAGGDITPPAVPFRGDYPVPGGSDYLQHAKLSKRDATVSNPTANNYRYQNINPDQVRLLCLHAGGLNDDIHCSLKTMLVSELEGSQIGYHALSYAWGEEVWEMIYVSDVPEGGCLPWELSLQHLTHAKFYVRTNLYAALKRLRCKDKAVWLWIDAICINQQDMTEKSRQLPRLLDLYENAWSVCVWLGESGPFSSCFKNPLDFVAVIVNLKLLDRIINGRVEKEILNSFVGFAQLLKRPWFQRRWVIQEVAASKRAFVQHGGDRVNWIDFADAVQLFLANIKRIRYLYDCSELSKWNPGAFSHIESVGAGAIVRATTCVLGKSKEGKIVARLWNIESLVLTFLHFEASDTRDTIYALLSLANDRDSYWGALSPLSHSREGIRDQPYNKFTAGVYSEFVYHCIRSTNSLDVICRHWALPIASPSDPILPSWAGLVTESSFGPSPKSSGRLNGDSLVGKPGQNIYNASRGSFPVVRLYIPEDHAPSNIPLCLEHGCLEMGTHSAMTAHWKNPVSLKTAYRDEDERGRRTTARTERSRASRAHRGRLESILELRHAKEDVEFYRRERDQLRNLLRDKGYLRLPRSKSPRHQRPRVCPPRESSEHFNVEQDSTVAQQDNEEKFGNSSLPADADAIESITQPNGDVSSADEGYNHQTWSISVHKRPLFVCIVCTLRFVNYEYFERHYIDVHFLWFTKSELKAMDYPLAFKRLELAHNRASNIQSNDAIDATLVPKRHKVADTPISSQSIKPSLQPSTHNRAQLIYGINMRSEAALVFGTSITLTVTGYRLCRITNISSCVVDGVITHDCLEMAGWSRHNDINDIPDRLWRTLVGDRMQDGSYAPSWWRRACMYCPSKASSDGDLNTSKLIANKSFPDTVLEFLKRVQGNVWNRRFFECKNRLDLGRSIDGFGSRNIREGDWCCILLGCSVPVVLREESERPFFGFIGECYIDGMMDGQALVLLKDQNTPPTEFPIR